MEFSPIIRQAIKCGPIPQPRDWRKLPVEELTRAEKIMAFAERYMMIPEGPLVGQPLKLAEFQEAFIYAIYDNPVQTKRAILTTARKNGKTATIAVITLAHIAGPEAHLNSRINSGALSRAQASEVYNYASKIIALSPALKTRCRLVPSSKRIIGLRKNVEYHALSAEGKTNHGGSPKVLILDETGQVRGSRSEFIDAVTTGQGAYDDAMSIVISTQASTDGDLLSLWIDDSERSKDPHLVTHAYCAAPDADILDERSWAAANPSLGIFRSIEDVRNQAAVAARLPAAEANFRNLFLNQRVNANDPFVTKQVWDENSAAPGDFGLAPVFGGLDLSATTDLTAFVLVARDEVGKLNVRPYFWIPEGVVEDACKRDRAPYDLWVKQGFLLTTPGKSIDYAFVARDIERITKGLDISMIAFDRWRMERLKARLDEIGVDLPLEPFGQGFQSFSPALDALENELLKGNLRHGAHPVLAMCAAGATVVKDPANNRKLDKVKSTNRIDGLVALTMAVSLESTRQVVDVGAWIV